MKKGARAKTEEECGHSGYENRMRLRVKEFDEGHKFEILIKILTDLQEDLIVFVSNISFLPLSYGSYDIFKICQDSTKT